MFMGECSGAMGDFVVRRSDDRSWNGEERREAGVRAREWEEVGVAMTGAGANSGMVLSSIAPFPRAPATEPERFTLPGIAWLRWGVRGAEDGPLLSKSGGEVSDTESKYRMKHSYAVGVTGGTIFRGKRGLITLSRHRSSHKDKT